MKTANKIGGILVAIVVVILVLAGIRSSTGRSVLSPLGDSFRAAWNAARTNLSGAFPTNVAGNAVVAAVVGLAIFAAAVIFIPGARAGRGMVATATAAAVLAFILYNPSIVT